jgi:hypothetical protein
LNQPQAANLRVAGLENYMDGPLIDSVGNSGLNSYRLMALPDDQWTRRRGLKSARSRKLLAVKDEESEHNEPLVQAPKPTEKKDAKDRRKESKITRRKSKASTSMISFYKELSFSRIIKDERMYVVDEIGKRNRTFAVNPEDSAAGIAFIIK